MATRRLHVARRLDHVGFSDSVQIRNQVLELREQGLPVPAFRVLPLRELIERKLCSLNGIDATWRMCWSPRAARTRCLSWWPQSHG